MMYHTWLYVLTKGLMFEEFNNVFYPYYWGMTRINPTNDGIEGSNIPIYTLTKSFIEIHHL